MTFAARFIRESSAAGAPPPSPPSVELVNTSLLSSVNSPDVASFSYKVGADGLVVATARTGSQNYPWINSGNTSEYEVRWVPSTGSLNPDSGAVNTWLPLSSDRVWTALFAGSFGERYYFATIQIRKINTSEILAEANFSATFFVFSIGSLLP